ncbi:MAG: PTS sugar transporter subunit IIB [Elusimicrobia bacterium]|nr:PTS sugar transporter subunit IIB [Elusimicrobiota bacterium]
MVFIRIDDRLVHGQVVEGWVPHLRADLVLVASDAAASDETQSLLMRLALPEGVELLVLPLGEASRHPALRGGYPGRALVLASGPQDVLKLLQEGAVFDQVNVGGLHYTAGRVQLGKAIFLSEEDKLALRKISQRGARLEGRALPGDKEADLLEMIASAELAR